MKERKYIIIGVAVIVLIVLAVVLSRSGGPTEVPKTVLNSADGVLTLEIPETVFPEGVRADDITIIGSDMDPGPDPLADEGEGAVFVTAYELGPDGTEFGDPITVTFVADWSDVPEDVVPFIVSMSGGEEDEIIEPADITGIEFNEEEGTLKVSGEVSHFSDIALWKVKGLFSIKPTSASTEHKVGDSFTWSAVVSPTGKAIKVTGKYGWSYGYTEFVYAPGTTWSVGGGIETMHAMKIMPNEHDFPWMKGIQGGKAINLSTGFTCEKKGSESIGSKSAGKGVSVAHTVQITSYSKYSAEKEYKKGGSRTESKNEYPYFRESHSCEEEEEQKGGFIRMNVPTTVICPENGKTYTGYYEQHPVTGERIGDVLLDLETGQPANFSCD